ncbi:hypothetical protein Tco_1076292, partial [Tanacetum coccineum]
IIIAQQQHATDVHPDELCPPKKRYDLMDPNKKVDLEHVQCPPESKILTNIIKNHPLRFSIAASSSVPWICMAQFWHTLKEDGSKYRLKYMLDKKELSLTLDDFRTIFHLPQENDNNHNSFVPQTSFSDMVLFYKEQLGFTMELKTSCHKMGSTVVADNANNVFLFNNIHIDYAKLLWEGIYYSLHHPTSSIPYPRFTKIIISHYMTIFPEISRHARDMYHNLQDDDIMKNIFNYRKTQDKLALQILERFLSRKSFDTLADHLQEVMVESLPTMVDTHIKEQVKKQVPEQVRDQVPVYVAEGLILERQKTKEEIERMIAKSIYIGARVPQTTCRPSAVRPRDQDDPHDDAHHEGENSAKRQKTSEYEAYVSGESSSGQNPHAKIFYIRKQKEPGKPKEEIVARRANECIVSITEPDYKNLNKNDIEDMYLLIMSGKVPNYAETGLLWSLLVFIRSSVIWERVHDFQLGIKSYQQTVNLTALTISFPGVEKHRMFSIIYEPVHGIIYKNSKKEKRVMRHSEIYKFCDATLNRVLEGLKSYNNDVKYGYVQRELANDEVEYLKLFEEEIEVRLKHRNQMRRCEMYVNGRPLGPRREPPE